MSSPNQVPTESDTFIDFHYNELKDLGNHFLTLASAILAFSVTFSDRFVPSGDQLPGGLAGAAKYLLLATWASLILAIIAAGTGVYFNYRAGAAAKGNIISRKPSDFRSLTGRTYSLYHVAGGAFVLSLLTLVAIGVLKVI